MSYRTLGLPEYEMANASNFMRGFTPASNPKGVTTYGQQNGLLFMLKGPMLKTVSYRTLGFPEYGMATASNFTRGLTPASNPKGVITYGQQNWLLFMLKGPRLKPVSYRTLGFPEYEMTNAINLKGESFEVCHYHRQQPQKGCQTVRVLLFIKALFKL